MGMIFMFLATPLQELLPVFAQSVLKGGPGLFGLMLSAISLGSILGACLLSCIPAYYPRHFVQLHQTKTNKSRLGLIPIFETITA
jgi:hypothetical protein